MPTVALQIDPIESLKPQTDTSLMLAREASRRGMQIFAYTPQNLTLNQKKLVAYGSWLKLDQDDIGAIQQQEKSYFDLENADFLLIRQDPPFDMSYMTSLYLLEHARHRVKILNDPCGIREAPEKLLITHFPDLTPPTLVSRDKVLINDFLSQQGRCVLKPLYAFGGEDIALLTPDNLSLVLEAHQSKYNDPPIIQKYIPEIEQGDRRVFLMDGVFQGLFSRVPQAGDFRSNTRIGGRPVACEPTSRELDICERLGPELKKRGLFFAGLDMIGPYVTEINVTSPTGLMLYEQLTGVDLSKNFWDALGA